MVGRIRWRQDYWWWLVLLIAAGLIGYMLIRAGEMSNQFHQLGTELGAQRATVTRVADYKYVVDLQHQLYYPNQPQYVQAIPSQYQVFVEDDETIKQWTGYKPGPRR